MGSFGVDRIDREIVPVDSVDDGDGQRGPVLVDRGQQRRQMSKMQKDGSEKAKLHSNLKSEKCGTVLKI